MTVWTLFCGMLFAVVCVCIGFAMGRTVLGKPVMPELPKPPRKSEDYDDFDEDPFNVAAYGTGTPFDESEK